MDLSFLLFFVAFGLKVVSGLSKKFARCDQPGVVSFVYKCIHQDSADYLLKHFKRIPITIMFDLMSFEDESKIELYRHMAWKGYDIGLFVDHNRRKVLEDGMDDPVYLKDLKNKFKKLFKQDLQFVYAAWTMTLKQSNTLRTNGLKTVLASFDFADTAYTALDIAEHHATARAQRSFIVVPDTHRHLGDSLVSDFVEIFKGAGFKIVPLSQCLNAALKNDHLINEF